jgi:hypothetical protein
MIRSLFVFGAACTMALCPILGGIAQADTSRDLAEAPSAQAPNQARVIERYGAAVREEPSADSPAIIRGDCNEIFLVVGNNGRWQEIFQIVGQPDEMTTDEDDDIFGWIAGDHLALGSDTAAIDCARAPSHTVGALLESFTDVGCLSLRSEPAAGELDPNCRADGVSYQVVSGPTTAGGEEWVRLQPSDNGAPGWAAEARLVSIP